MKMPTEYGKRLKLARDYAKLTQDKLAIEAGVRQSAVQFAESKAAGSAKTPVFAAICGVNPLWLATGEGSMLDLTPSTVSTRDKELLSLSENALDIALAFDKLVGRELRTRTHVALMSWILAVLDAPDAPPTPLPKIPVARKKQRA